MAVTKRFSLTGTEASSKAPPKPAKTAQHWGIDRPLCERETTFIAKLIALYTELETDCYDGDVLMQHDPPTSTIILDLMSARDHRNNKSQTPLSKPSSEPSRFPYCKNAPN